MTLTLMKLYRSLSLEQQKAFGVGWCSGIIYMAVAQSVTAGKTIRRYKRHEAFIGRVMDDVWVHLPPEVKDEFINEAHFYNIAFEEDIT